MISDVLDKIHVGRQFLVFGLIGVVNTAIHAGIVIILIEKFGTNQVFANTTAFAAANLFSYFANSILTFKKSPSFTRYFRFLISSLGTLFITIFISSVGDIFDINYYYTMATIIVISPIVNFMILKYYAFR